MVRSHVLRHLVTTLAALLTLRAAGPAAAQETARAAAGAQDTVMAGPLPMTSADSVAADLSRAAIARAESLTALPATLPPDYIAEVRANFTPENRARSPTAAGSPGPWYRSARSSPGLRLSVGSRRHGALGHPGGGPWPG